MQYVSCGKGHFYDPDQYQSCPYCAEGGSSQGSFSMDNLGATEPLYGRPDAMGGNIGGMMGATEPLYGRPDAVGGNVGGMDTIGATMPLDGPAAKTSPLPNNYSGDPLATSYFQDPASNPTVEEYGATQPVSPVKDATGAQAGPLLPVVGWLVCIDGPAKGRDYRIHSQYNSIGRARHMDICIEGDNTISSDRAALLAYDDVDRIFYFAPGQGRNIVRVNGRTVMVSVELKAYDELTIGSTKLLFVPLCGERFDWNGK